MSEALSGPGASPEGPGGASVEGLRDPEHDPRAAYALEPEYVARLTDRILATTGTTTQVGG